MLHLVAGRPSVCCLQPAGWYVVGPRCGMLPPAGPAPRILGPNCQPGQGPGPRTGIFGYVFVYLCLVYLCISMYIYVYLSIYENLGYPGGLCSDRRARSFSAECGGTVK